MSQNNLLITYWTKKVCFLTGIIAGFTVVGPQNNQNVEAPVSSNKFRI
jgi:hypothetical protein